MRAAFVSVLLLLAVAGSASPAVAAERLCDSAFEDCRRPLLDLIANERVGLDVAFWFMEDSRYANAIIARWNAGVPVRVVIDTKANTSYPGNVRMLQMLADAGIPMRRKTPAYLHWKMMLFVGQNTVQFSGANYSPNAFVANQKYVDYVDEVIYFTDDPAIVNSFKTKYDDVWVSTSGYTNYANITTPLTRNHATYPLSASLNFPPSQNFATRSATRYNAEDVGIDSIMYRIDDARHTDAILAAVRRGVPVRLITEQEQYRDPVRLWHSYNVDRLFKGGVYV
jgi:phosphatidylserine/phosphatidylglycerophosphate/cardiolipin synthase-like enzyme